ncbi:MAG: hypothetical protein ACI8QZ_002219 [Chlamydiales bacterium]|jgi:hypothetical protein
MNLDDIWQENKRFIASVAAGLMVFLIGTVMVDRLYGSELRSARTQLRSNERSLRTERLGSEALAQAREVNDALHEALTQLSDAAAFETRDHFKLTGGEGSPSGKYFALVDRVRDGLLTLASRNRLRLPADLGLQMLQTTRVEVIERHAEALDVIDRVVRLCVEVGVERIDSIQVRLDPAFDSRHGLGQVERTRVTFKITSAAQPVVELLARTQNPGSGQALSIENVDLIGSRSKQDEVRAEVTFLVVRLHQRESADEEI